MSGVLLKLEGITKTFERSSNAIMALSPTDLTVERKEFVALVGPSGCGKSTILNMVAGLLQPSGGKLAYDGKPVEDLNLRVGYMTQKDTLLPWRTVTDNIGAPLELACRRTSKSERADKIRQMIELVGLKGFENHYPGELSGGMRRRVAFARMLIYDPETLLMDEPFGALDPITRDSLAREYRAAPQSLGLTTVMITHDMLEAVLLADRIAVMNAGEIVAIGTPHDLLTNPKNDYVRELIDVPRRQASEVERLAEGRL